MSTTLTRRAAAMAFAATMTIPLAQTATAAPAEPANPTATQTASQQIAYQVGTGLYIANRDGSSPRYVDGASGRPAWSPDGSRYVYNRFDCYYEPPCDGRLLSRRSDDSDLFAVVDFASRESAKMPAWTADGRRIISSGHVDCDRQHGCARIRVMHADGSEPRNLFPPDGDHLDTAPTVAPDGTVVFTRDGTQLWRYAPGDPGPTLLVDGDADRPVTGAAFAPGGHQLAYAARDADTSDTHIWVARQDGSDAVQLTHAGGTATEPAWAPDGRTIAFTYTPDQDTPTSIKEVDMASGALTTLVQRGASVAWQPGRRDAVDRAWGDDHVETAIATSRYSYFEFESLPPKRPAYAVVLTRDDLYYDALVGSAFAAANQAPLLVTNRDTLDPRVAAEIERVISFGWGPVYLLGGEQALSPRIADRLTELGVQVERIAGETHFDTALEINRRLVEGGARPRTAIVTTGTDFPDALAAGAAAGANPDTVIVLTDGWRMPASSAAYLDALNPDPTDEDGTAIVTAGGPGDHALRTAYRDGQLPSWSNLEYARLVGDTAPDTAVRVAEHFFAAPPTAAVATSRNWYDALSGGAMVAVKGGPLLITPPDRLHAAVRRYLSVNSGSLARTAMLGGPVALPASLVAPIGDAIVVPGRWDYADIHVS